MARLHAREKVNMENPADWKPLELAVAHACAEWREANREGVIGLSLPAYVARHLRAEKFVDDSHDEPVGIERLRQGDTPPARPEPPAPPVPPAPEPEEGPEEGRGEGSQCLAAEEK